MNEQTPLLGLGVWFQPGPATLIVREAGWALLVPGVRKPMIEAVWTVLAEPPDPARILDAIVEAAGLEGVEKIPSILIGLVSETSAALVVKGTSPLAVYDAAGRRLVAGTADEPVAVVEASGVRRLAFGDLPAEESTGGLRLGEGMARVRGFVQMTVDPAQLSAEEREALAGQVAEDGRSIETPEQKAEKASRPAPAARASAPTPSTPAPASDPAPAPAPPRPAAPAARRPATVRRPATTTSARPAAAAESAAPSAPSVFDGLFGGAAPSRADQPAEPARSAPAPSAPAADAPAASPPAAPTAEPEAAGTAPDPRPAAAAPATPAGAAAVPAAPAGEPSAASAGGPRPGARRRLVSTSLFDRGRTAASAPSEPQRAADAADPAPEPAPPHGPETPPEPEDEEPGAITLVAPIEEGDDAPAPTPRPRRPAPAGPLTPPARTPAPAPAPAATPPPAPAAEPAQEAAGHPAQASPDLEATGTYDVLFGPTVHRRIEDAAIRIGDESAEEPHEATSAAGATASQELGEGSPAPEPEEEPAASAPSAAGPASAAIGDFIDWVPGVGREAPEIARTAARRAAGPAAAAPQGQPASPQVRVAERPQPPRPAPAPIAQDPAPAPGPAAAPAAAAAPAPAPAAAPMAAAASTPAPAAAPAPASAPPPAMPRRGEPAPPPRPQQPAPGAPAHPASPRQAPRGQRATASSAPVLLSGLLCDAGHANPPELSTCRACGRPLAGPVRSVPRPALGRIELSTGESFRLDRSAIIGRKPRASRVSGREVPQLITVPSPQQDISRSHLELRLEGWHVVALDLGTTNGTTLLREGTVPRRLSPHHAVMLQDLDILDLGDGVRLRMREAG